MPVADAPAQPRPQAAGRNDHSRAAAAAREAAFAFLGRLEVCGVGAGGAPEPRIVFLLRRDSDGARAVLARWAAQRRVPIEIRVAGDIPAAPDRRARGARGRRPRNAITAAAARPPVGGHACTTASS
jgi:hypothetical protein